MRIRAKRALENNSLDHLFILMERDELGTLRNVGKKDIKEIEDVLMEHKINMMELHARIEDRY